jgi:hypothetical protein
MKPQIKPQATFHECVDPEALFFDPEKGGTIGWDLLSDDAQKMMIGAVLHIHPYGQPNMPSLYAYRAVAAPEDSFEPIDLIPAPELAGDTCQTWLYESIDETPPYVGLSNYSAKDLARFTAGFRQREGLAA